MPQARAAVSEMPFRSNIVGCGSDEVYCDMPAEVTWEDVDETFSPAAGLITLT
jgi:hypothetical protein